MSNVDYSKALPKPPAGMGWHLSWIDREQKASLVIALNVKDECVHRKVLAVDLYGIEGVRETSRWMLDKWLASGVVL